MKRGATILWALLAACGDDGDSDPDLIDAPRCVDALDTSFTHNFLIGNATLRANDISIVVDGVTHRPPTDPALYGLAADESNGVLPDQTTFEMFWLEGETTNMRLNIYFESDGVDWWARELRHDDGLIGQNDWIYYDRELFRCPIGQHFVGDLSFEADPGTRTASISFEDLWVRAFVEAEPPGVQQTATEAMLRPFCSWALGCASPDTTMTMNNCLFEYERRAPAFRPDVYAQGIGCLSTVACGDDSAMIACWRDQRPPFEPYHTAFKAQCDQFSTACSGAPDPDCSGLSLFFYVDLPFYSERFVSELAECVGPDAMCSTGLGFCLDRAGAPYGIDL